MHVGYMADGIETVIALRERPRDPAEQFGVGVDDAAYQMCAPGTALDRFIAARPGHCKELL
jgi:hypothetical protein